MVSSQFNNPSAIQSGSVTYVPGKSTNAVISLVKSGNVCSLTISNGSFTASAGETFAVIPEGFRPGPNYTVDYLDSYNKNRIQISPNGEISCQTALSNTVVRGSVTYITNH